MNNFIGGITMHQGVKNIKYLYNILLKRMVHVNLQLLYSCNFKCRICDFWKAPYNAMPSLTLENTRIIAEKLKAFGPVVISIGGGEPLIHPDLLEITRCLARDNFLAMICNGWFVTPEKAAAIFKAGMHEVSVSLDYINPEKHDRQRGMAGAFDQAIKALKILNENRISANQRVHMISVVMDDNLEDIEPLILLARKIGITYMVTLYCTGRGKKESKVPITEAGAYLLKLKKKYPDFVSLPGYIKKFQDAVADQRGIAPCYAGKNLCNIDCRGNVSLCIDTLDQPVGNIITGDLEDIKQGLLGKYRDNKCAQCWTSCRGSIESLMYGKNRFYNWLKCYQIVKKAPLQRIT